jgi:hypothetical protein
MPRALSAPAKAAIFAQETGEVFLQLVTISHATLTPSLRFVENTVDITSRGNLYLACPFRMVMPAERDDAMPTVQLQIDNVDRLIIEGVRALPSRPTVTYEVVLASSPDTLEGGPFDFSLTGCEYDALVITGTLAFEDVLNEPAVQHSFTPAKFPGLFP